MNEQGMNNMNNMSNQPRKKKKSGCAEVLVVIIGICFGFFFVLPNLVSDNLEENEKQKESNIKVESTQKPQVKKQEKEKKKTLSKKEYIKKCKEYDYKKVLRNPDKYIGKKVKVRLKVSQVHEESILNASKYYFAYSNDEYDMWVGNEYAIMDMRDEEKPKILEDDIIEVYGEIAEPEQTKSLIMASSEVFSINMKYAKLIKG